MSDFRKSLRRNIRRKPPSKPVRRSTNEQAKILSGLNVLHVLEDNAPKYLQTVLHYGPDTFVGTNWAGSMVWYRRKGYQNYRQLTLFGVWASKRDDVTKLIIGTKTLKYSAPVFNAESYNTLIKQNFKSYYGDDASPPDASRILYQTDFDITRRLALRREIADKLVYWLRYSLIQK